MNLRDELAAAILTSGSSPDTAYMLADVVIERRSQAPDATMCCNFDPELTFRDDPRPVYELFCHQCKRAMKATTYRLVVEVWNASNT